MLPDWLDKLWDSELLRDRPRRMNEKWNDDALVAQGSAVAASQRSSCADNLYRRAKDYQEQGQNPKAILVYGRILQKQLEDYKLDGSYDAAYPPLAMRFTIKQTLSAFYKQYPDLAPTEEEVAWIRRQRRHDRPMSHYGFLANAVEHQAKPDTIDMSRTIRAFADYVFRSSSPNFQSSERGLKYWGPRLEQQDRLLKTKYSGLVVAEQLYLRVLGQFEDDLGPDHDETMRAVQGLVTLYVYKGDELDKLGEKMTWSEQERMMRRGLDSMEKLLGCDHPDVLELTHALGERYLHQELLEDAEELLRLAFEGQRKVLGVNTPQTRRTVDNLVGLYIGQEQYVEAEALLKEALDPAKVSETNESSDNYSYWRWYQEDHSLQGEIASLKTPGEFFYSEDSRVYLREFHQLTLVPTFPSDPFPKSPASVTVLPERCNLHISQRCFQDFANIPAGPSLRDMTNELMATAIWRFLDSKRLNDLEDL